MTREWLATHRVSFMFIEGRLQTSPIIHHCLASAGHVAPPPATESPVVGSAPAATESPRTPTFDDHKARIVPLVTPPRPVVIATTSGTSPRRRGAITTAKATGGLFGMQKATRSPGGRAGRQGSGPSMREMLARYGMSKLGRF